MINKEQFVKCINQLKKHDEMLDDVNKIFKKNNQDTVIFDTDLHTVIVDLLKNVFDDNSQYSNIEYFIYDLEYGKKYKSGMITDKDDKDILLSSAEELYDFLILEQSTSKI